MYMKPDLSWDLYKSFLAVMKAQSLSGAAKALGIAQPTVGRHIDALEEALEATLFTRSQNGFAPTDFAFRLLPFADNMFATSTAILRELSEHREIIEGTVRITASEIIGVEILPSILATIHNSHPRLKLELVVTNQSKNLLTCEADIAVRMFKPTQQSLLIRKAGEVELGWHAHKTYLNRHGTPKDEHELKKHSLIGFDHETDFIRAFKEKIGNIDRSNFAMRTDSDLAQLAAIRSGYGIGICQTRLAQKDPNLIRILPKTQMPKLSTWVTMHENLKTTARYKVVFSSLVSGLTEYLSE